MNSDVLVIGSGIAGLSYALKVAEESPDTHVAIITKKRAEDSNTLYAQGGIAAAIDPFDSPAKHIEDTLRAGQGLSDIHIVKMVVENALPRIDDLIGWGVAFDQRPDYSFDLHLEGGHSSSRVMHCKDKTGSQVEKILLRRVLNCPNIRVYEEYFAVDLMVGISGVTAGKPQKYCYGATVFDSATEKILPFFAKVTVLASGGAGQVFEMTTNPKVACGDGVAMASRAGATIRDMHYMQFHPTAFYNRSQEPCFLISEAVRGHGAYLVDREGRRFMAKYDTRGELATRDIVSGAIQAELSLSGDTNVFLDCRHLDADVFAGHFPTIVSYCSEAGIHIQDDMIPVIPAAHYQCGGIRVDQHAATDIGNLLAIGECASTGLHGANRLASNSLLEALVFAHNASRYTLKRLCETDHMFPDAASHGREEKQANEMCDPLVIARLRSTLRAVMSRNAGINRSEESVLKAQQVLVNMHELAEQYFMDFRLTVPLLELRNLTRVALLITEHAMQHFKADPLPKILQNA